MLTGASSARGQEQAFKVITAMSALTPTADIDSIEVNVAYRPRLCENVVQFYFSGKYT
jgi:hypothetical protein